MTTDYPFVVTISSEKGGVGKTTLATNLAVFLKALSEDLPVSIFSFDNHFTVDKMFELKGQPVKGTVADFLQGTPGADLLHTGQYGVNYIPSSRDLHTIRHSFSGSLFLAEMLSVSNIPGIVIIDTRPELDILTQNALFAADRALIPVKDMASLENCRNIFDLFDNRGFDRKSLSLVPCIIDSRIKFDGPFQDQRSLLRAYAINRGFRCLDTYISKSPKVESLGTNPSGKVLPVFSYARNTEAFGQFTQLAEFLLDGYSSTRTPRSKHFHDWLLREQARKMENFNARKESLKNICILCSSSISEADADRFGYYFESSDGSACGFLDERCVSDLLVAMMFNSNPPQDDHRRVLLREAFRGSSLLFRPDATGTSAIDFSRYSPGGELLQRNRFESAADGIFGRLFCSETGYREDKKEFFLLAHPVAEENPDEILVEENYRRFVKMKQSIVRVLST